MSLISVGMSGASSSIGRVLVQELLSFSNVTVSCFGKTNPDPARASQFRKWTLGMDLPASEFDVFLHLAYDRRDLELSNYGTLRIARQLAQGPKKTLQVLFSSLSSFPETLSAYGRAKYQLERNLIQVASPLVVVRPGILMANTGMGKGFFWLVRYSPMLPREIEALNVRQVSVDDLRYLCRIIVDAAPNVSGEINLCSSSAFSESDVVAFRKTPWIPIPIKVFLSLGSILYNLLPSAMILRDQIAGMLSNVSSPHHKTENGN